MYNLKMCPHDLSDKQKKGGKRFIIESVGVYVSLCPFSSSPSPLCSTFQPPRSYLYWLRTGRIAAVRGQFLELWDTNDQRADMHGDDNHLSIDRWEERIKCTRGEAGSVKHVENFLFAQIMKRSRKWDQAGGEKKQVWSVCSKSKWSGKAPKWQTIKYV